MKTKTTHGISFPDHDLLDKAKAKAKHMGISVSNYVNQLVKRDMGLPSLFDGASLSSADFTSRDEMSKLKRASTLDPISTPEPSLNSADPQQVTPNPDLSKPLAKKRGRGQGKV